MHAHKYYVHVFQTFLRIPKLMAELWYVQKSLQSPVPLPNSSIDGRDLTAVSLFLGSMI
jgi:hypothetical protein